MPCLMNNEDVTASSCFNYMHLDFWVGIIVFCSLRTLLTVTHMF